MNYYYSDKTTIPGGAKKKRVNPKTVKKFATRLYNAAANGNEETVKQYIEKLQNVGKISANVVGENPSKRTALMVAAFNGHTAIVNLLLDPPLRRGQFGVLPLELLPHFLPPLAADHNPLL